MRRLSRLHDLFSTWTRDLDHIRYTRSVEPLLPTGDNAFHPDQA
jgi:hypothetical protein